MRVWLSWLTLTAVNCMVRVKASSSHVIGIKALLGSHVTNISEEKFVPGIVVVASAPSVYRVM